MAQLPIQGQAPQLIQLSQPPQQQVRIVSAALVHQLQAQGLTVSVFYILSMHRSKIYLTRSSLAGKRFERCDR